MKIYATIAISRYLGSIFVKEIKITPKYKIEWTILSKRHSFTIAVRLRKIFSSENSLRIIYNFYFVVFSEAF